MAAPTHGDAQFTQSTGTTVVVSEPTDVGTDPNTRVVVIANTADTGTTTVISMPSPWVKHNQEQVDIGSFRVYGAIFSAPAADVVGDGSFTVSMTASALQNGAYAVTVFDTAGFDESMFEVESGATAPVPEVVTSEDECLILTTWKRASGTASTPSGFNLTESFGSGAFLWDKEQATAGATGTPTVTSSNTGNGATTSSSWLPVAPVATRLLSVGATTIAGLSLGGTTVNASLGAVTVVQD